MTRDDDRSRAGRDRDGVDGDGGPDLVADFFAAERDTVRPLSADDVRWQRITREHRSRGVSWLRYAAVAAAVVLISGGVGLAGSLKHQSAVPAAQPTVTRTVYVPAPAASAVLPPGPGTPSSIPTAPPSATGGAPAVRVPDDFTVLSVTTVASGRLFALGSASCAGRPCALLATSSDRGATWTLRSRVPGVVAAPRLATSLPSSTSSTSAPSLSALSSLPATVGSGVGVTDVRFASDTVGWVFGSTVLRTTDGGLSWAPYGHGSSGPVLALETDGSGVVLAAAVSCSAPACTGAVNVSRAAVGASSATVVGSPLALGQGYLGLDLAWRQQNAVLSVRAGSQSPPAATVRGSTVTTLPPPDCSGAPSVIAAPADGSGLVLVCGSSTGGGRLGPVFSGDGTSWSPVADASPTLAPGSLLAAAAVDPRHLVLAAGGTTDDAGALSVSADAGRTWHAPVVQSAPVGGFAWVGSPGGRTYYALPARPSGSFWRSDDAGQTWKAVAVR